MLDSYSSFIHIPQGCFTVSWLMPPWEIVGWRPFSEVLLEWKDPPDVAEAIFDIIIRDHFMSAPHQWETMLQCNVISHWLGAYTKRSLVLILAYSLPDHLKLWYLPCKIPWFPWGRISTTHIISVLRNYRKCEYIFPEMVSAWQELS